MSQELQMTKNGITVPVRVNPTFDGRFEATVGDEKLDAPTWPELEKLVDKATKRVSRKVDVPFTAVSFRIQSDQVIVRSRQATATGLHSGTGNVLVRYADGAKEQLSSWGARDMNIFRPLARTDVDEYAALYRAARNAQDSLSHWVKANKIDLKAKVSEALNEGSPDTN